MLYPACFFALQNSKCSGTDHEYRTLCVLCSLFLAIWRLKPLSSLLWTLKRPVLPLLIRRRALARSRAASRFVARFDYLSRLSSLLNLIKRFLSNSQKLLSTPRSTSESEAENMDKVRLLIHLIKIVLL